MSNGKTLAANRRARYEYEILESVEAGLVLLGTEIKAMREGRANISEAYARPIDREIYLINAHINEYAQAGPAGHEPRRPRKLLLHRRQIDRLLGAVQRDGATLVPLKLYFNERGIAKLQIGLAHGKRKQDKRESEKKRDWERQRGRLMRAKG